MKRGLGLVLETQTQYSPLSAPQDGLNVTKTKKSVKKHTSSKIPEKKKKKNSGAAKWQGEASKTDKASSRVMFISMDQISDQHGNYITRQKKCEKRYFPRLHQSVTCIKKNYLRMLEDVFVITIQNLRKLPWSRTKIQNDAPQESQKMLLFK